MQPKTNCGHIFNVRGNGRLGNLMFEFASAAGVCAFRNLDPTECARITLSPNMTSNIMIPLDEFINEFKIPRYETNICPTGDEIEYAENQGDFYRTVFDPYVLNIPSSATLQGYFQSHRYFYPHADEFVRKIFNFSSTTNRVALSYFNSIRNKISREFKWKDDDYEFVCMAVRRGDKTNKNASPIYSKWALSVEYYKLAIQSMRMKSIKKKMAIFVSVGGSISNSELEGDRKWLKREIIDPLTTSSLKFVTDFDFQSANSFVSMKLISSFPNIIVSSSSFSWWAAYLSNDAYVVAPKLIYSSMMTFTPSDYYPPGWELIDKPKTKFISRPQKTTPGTGKQETAQNKRNLGSDLTTVVTSYYNIPSKYNHSISYLRWIPNFMAMDFKCVIFVDSFSFRKLSKKWPPTHRRSYLIKEISDFESSHGKWNWFAQELLDPEYYMGHNALLYKLWSEKVFMVGETVRLNPYNTLTFAWTDVGAFRDPSILPMLNGYPDPTKFNTRKVTFPQIMPFTREEQEHIEIVDNRFIKTVRIGGGHFAGSGMALLRFAVLFRSMLTEFQNAGVFYGKDQSLFAYLILRHPYWFETANPTECPTKFEVWSCIQFRWATSAPALLPTLLYKHEHAFAKFSLPTEKNKCLAHFLILSTPESVKTRDAVRSGWITRLSLMRPVIKFRYHFIVGRKKSQDASLTTTFLRNEIDSFRDVVILPFWESYNNLTIKVALMLKWAAQKYPDCPYIFKIDDDVVLRSNAFAFFIRKSLPPGDTLAYGGHVYDQKTHISEVSREPSNRNSLRLEDFPFKFSPYAAGPCYFISTSLAKALPYAIISVSTPIGVTSLVELVPDFYYNHFFNPISTLEDVFFGHFIWQMKNVLVLDIYNMFPWRSHFSQHPRLLAVWAIKSLDLLHKMSHEDEDVVFSRNHKSRVIRGSYGS